MAEIVTLLRLGGGGWLGEEWQVFCEEAGGDR